MKDKVDSMYLDDPSIPNQCARGEPQTNTLVHTPTGYPQVDNSDPVSNTLATEFRNGMDVVATANLSRLTPELRIILP